MKNIPFLSLPTAVQDILILRTPELANNEALRETAFIRYARNTNCPQDDHTQASDHVIERLIEHINEIKSISTKM